MDMDYTCTYVLTLVPHVYLRRPLIDELLSDIGKGQNVTKLGRVES